MRYSKKWSSKTECTLIFPKRVMVSGYFDGIHNGHLDYLEQSRSTNGFIICVVASDEQLLKKKGKVFNNQKERCHLVDVVLRGLRLPHEIYVNCSVDGTVADVLRVFRPEIFFRGYDKTLETMPEAERKACEELGIKIRHAKNRIGERHSSEIFK